MTLPLGALGGPAADRLFRNWFSSDEKLRPVCDLLLGSIYNPDQYVQSTFLSLVQAVESFHRRLYDGNYLSKEDYENLRKNLAEAIPKDTQKDIKEKLQSMLAWGNEVSLKVRLKRLLEGIDQGNAAQLAGTTDIQEFTKLIVDIRNYLTHYDESKKPAIIENFVEMYNLNRRMRAILTLLILKYLGLAEDQLFLPLKSNLGLVH
jgi:flagellar motor switch protein FliG